MPRTTEISPVIQAYDENMKVKSIFFFCYSILFSRIVGGSYVWDSATGHLVAALLVEELNRNILLIKLP